jgi:tRNA A22 N-methylase
MLFFSYVIKHIIKKKNKILHKLFYALFAPYNKKVKMYLYLSLKKISITYEDI